jgi:Caspase recruitment domain
MSQVLVKRLFFCAVADYETRAKIRKLRDSLGDVLEADRGLLAHLLSKGVLSFRQFDEVRSKRTALERSRRLVSHLLDSYAGDYDTVMEVLKECGQEHIVNYINSVGGKFTRLNVSLCGVVRPDPIESLKTYGA